MISTNVGLMAVADDLLNDIVSTAHEAYFLLAQLR